MINEESKSSFNNFTFSWVGSFASCGGNTPENKPDENTSPNVSIETQLLNTISKLENETVEPIDMDDVNWIKYVSISMEQVHLMGYSIGSGDKTKVCWFFPPNVNTNESDSNTCIDEKVGAETKGQDFYDAWSKLIWEHETINNTGTDLVLRLRFGADDKELKMFDNVDGQDGVFNDRRLTSYEQEGFGTYQYSLDGSWVECSPNGEVHWGTTNWDDPLMVEHFKGKTEYKVTCLKDCYYENWHNGYYGY
ncbi:MAG: hypothetical protein R2883_05315 [Caldisericia bacterium]